MNGLMLKKMFLSALNEAQEDMIAVDLFSIYSRLDEAAQIWVRETKSIRSTATITTVANQQAYDLPADFLGLYVRQQCAHQSNPRYVIRHDSADGNSTVYPVLTAYETIWRLNVSDPQTSPRAFAIVDKATSGATISGFTSAAGAVLNGKAQLIDAAAEFSGFVTARDTVLNLSRESSGLIVRYVDGQTLNCALFPEGINSWASGDSYIIQPQARKQIHLDAPSAEDGGVISVPYIASPPPVYTELDAWRLDFVACRAIAYEAAFLHQMSARPGRANQGHHTIFMDALKAERYKLARRRIEGC
jgi:hypothetical protein